MEKLQSVLCRHVCCRWECESGREGKRQTGRGREGEKPGTFYLSISLAQLLHRYIQQQCIKMWLWAVSLADPWPRTDERSSAVEALYYSCVYCCGLPQSPEPPSFKHLRFLQQCISQTHMLYFTQGDKTNKPQKNKKLKNQTLKVSKKWKNQSVRREEALRVV